MRRAFICLLTIMTLAAVAHAGGSMGVRHHQPTIAQRQAAFDRAVRAWVLQHPADARRIAQGEARAIAWDQRGPDLVRFAPMKSVGLGKLGGAWARFTAKRSRAARRAVADLSWERYTAVRAALRREGINPLSIALADVNRSATDFVRELPALERALAPHGIRLMALAPAVGARLVERSTRSPEGTVTFPLDIAAEAR